MVRVLFMLDRVKAPALQHPKSKTKGPFASLLKGRTSFRPYFHHPERDLDCHRATQTLLFTQVYG